MLLLIILSEERLVKGCKHLVIRRISLVNLMYNMVTIVNNTVVLYTGNLLIEWIFSILTTLKKPELCEVMVVLGYVN